MKIALCLPDKPGYTELLAEGLKDHDCVNLHALSPEERKKALLEADGLFTHWLGAEIRDDELPLLGRLKFVQTLSAGVDHIDFSKLPAETKLYSNIGAWAEGMAETCLGMTFGLLRAFGRQKKAMQDGQFDRGMWPLRSITEIRILIWGFGGIGRQCADLLWKLGANISALGRRKPVHEKLEAAYDFSQFDEALAACDLLVIAAPATKETVGALDARRLNLMPDDGMIVNLARASLINRDALEAHLKNHPDFSVGLDVWWNEGKNWDRDPLVFSPQVIASMHNSQETRRAWTEALKIGIRRVNALASGQEGEGRTRLEDYR